MVNLFKKYKIAFLILFLVLFIACLLLLINFNPFNSENTQVKSDLKGYDLLKQSFNELDNDTTIPKNARYEKIKVSIISLQNSKLSKKQKYEILASIENSLFDVYLLTKNNKLYNLNSKIDDFSKTNFPEYYKEKDFGLLVCYDPACADSPQPEEILIIIDEISSSNLPEDVKKSDIEILYIYTFATKAQASARVQNYYFLAQMIKTSPEYEKAGLNIKISDEIMNYLKTNYPDLLSEESGNKY